MKNLTALILSICLFLGCSHYLVGKTINPKYCYPLKEDLKRHYIEYTSATFNYGFVIDDRKNEITFDGSVKLNPSEIAGGNRIFQLKINFNFCDENYQVVASKYLMLYDKSTFEPIAFKKTFPYSKDYYYVAVDFSGYVD